jgi:hypothetical protein
MPRKSREQIEFEAEQTFFKYYMQAPKSIRQLTRPLVKTGVRTGRQLGPYTKQARAKADVWIDTNVKSIANKYLGKAKKVGGVVTSMYSKKKKK